MLELAPSDPIVKAYLKDLQSLKAQQVVHELGPGKELARLHVEYESLDPWPLEFVENKDVPTPSASPK